ncbi:MAG: ATP-binding cassette domain-containing protein [Erysipelotrichaceae bacterium]
MIKLQNVNKYFNRHKKNEIHVIDNTTLELGDNGLVALLGPSGCGKTTLLNAIGGLDNISKGSITIDGKKISSRLHGKKDKIRALNIGYIFQDYHLVNDMSVFDNVAIALKMIGVKDKQEINDKVNFVLETVGMSRYKKRLVTMLSGGQRQRVGIARALVKNPKIIIADEPTGNLDSANTIEVMNIIKKISQSCLVILVTHEKKLAHFYASRIIELKDGQIVNDYANDHENSLDYKIDNKIYLRDIEDKTRVVRNNIKFDYYNEDNKELNIKVVSKNGSIYIQILGENNVEILNDNSVVQLIDDNYKSMTKEDYEDYNFDLTRLRHLKKIKYRSIVSVFDAFKLGVNKLMNYSLIKKLLMVGFVISAMSTLFAISSVAGTLNIKDTSFTTTNHNYLQMSVSNLTPEQYQKIVSFAPSAQYVTIKSSVALPITYKKYYQTSNLNVRMIGDLVDSSVLKGSDIIAGALPSQDNHLVVDKKIIDKMINDNQLSTIGLDSYENFIDLSLDFSPLGSFTIVGITDLQDPSIYANNTQFTNLLKYFSGKGGMETPQSDGVNIEDYNVALRNGNIVLTKGNYPTGVNETIIPESMKDSNKINTYLNVLVNGNKLKVVGYYSSNINSSINYVSNQTIYNHLISSTSDLYFYSSDKALTMSELNKNEINAMDVYQRDYDQYKKDNKDRINSTLLVSGIIVAISLLEIFLIIRSSFLSKVKEVGIYRVIGVKKRDIYKMFLGEILVITTVSSVIGIGLMYFIINGIIALPLMGDKFVLNNQVVGATIIIVYAFNLLFGLFPVFNTIRKVPAKIINRNDVD